jgi:hypothetical protein
MGFFFIQSLGGGPFAGLFFINYHPKHQAKASIPSVGAPAPTTPSDKRSSHRAPTLPRHEK